MKSIAIWLSFLFSFVTICQSYLPSSKLKNNLKLILISGCTGTGKSTFGMEAAISHGILKCISTDTIRHIKRSFDQSPGVHRSSHSGDGDPKLQWIETCTAIEDSVENIIEDCINRGTSIVLEGVNLVPSNKLINKWRESGGTAAGVLLHISDPNDHLQILRRRSDPEELKNFDRIRSIQDEMLQLANQNDWLTIEQKPMLRPRALEVLSDEIDFKMQRVWVEGKLTSLIREANMGRKLSNLWDTLGRP